MLISIFINRAMKKLKSLKVLKKSNSTPNNSKIDLFDIISYHDAIFLNLIIWLITWYKSLIISKDYLNLTKR